MLFHTSSIVPRHFVVVALLISATTTAYSAKNSAASCDVAVVGAGPGGAYTANRLATSFKNNSKRNVCVFEQQARVGGRVHSLRHMGPRGDLVVEAGAYRFAMNRTCEPESEGRSWCIETPLTKAIILSYLGLRTKQYDPRDSNWDHNLSVIVDDNGHEAGYVTFVEQLLARVNDTVSVQYGKRLMAIEPTAGSGYTLRFGDGTTATAGQVVLNMPQTPLLRVLARSTELMSKEAEVPEALHAVVAFPLMKFYVHYDDAWWINDLGLRAGSFNNSAEWAVKESSQQSETCTGSTQLPVPVQGSYHDGDVRCDGPNGRCRGYLQAVYMPQTQALRLYEQFHVSNDDGDAAARLNATTSAEDARVLRRVHQALVELHADALRAKGTAVLERVMGSPPDSGVLAIWDQRAAGVETGCHLPRPMRSRPSALFPDDNGVPEARIPIDAMRPLAHSPGIFVANEAFGTMHCFAEASLVMAENIVHSGFGLPKPDWIDEDTYNKDVLFNTTAEIGPLADRESAWTSFFWHEMSARL